MTDRNTNNSTKLAAISYLTIIGTIIAYFLNRDKNNPFAAFHIRQALGLWLSFYILGYIISYFDSWMITFSFWIFMSVLILYGFFSALTNKQQTVPIVGPLYQKYCPI